MMKLRRLTGKLISYFQGGLFPLIQCKDQSGIPQPCDLTQAEQLVARVLQFLFAFAGTVAVGVVLWGAFQFVTSGGDQAKAEGARKTLFAGLIGAIIVIAGYAFVRVFANTIFGGTIDIKPELVPKL